VPQEAEKNTKFLITMHGSTHQVTAARAWVDERLFPGYTLMKDDAGTIVAFVPTAAQPYIRRADADLTYGSRPAPPAPRPPRATSADLGRLAGIGHKAGDV
jgi:hypothetical protein